MGRKTRREIRQEELEKVVDGYRQRVSKMDIKAVWRLYCSLKTQRHKVAKTRRRIKKALPFMLILCVLLIALCVYFILTKQHLLIIFAPAIIAGVIAFFYVMQNNNSKEQMKGICSQKRVVEKVLEPYATTAELNYFYQEYGEGEVPPVFPDGNNANNTPNKELWDTEEQTESLDALNEDNDDEEDTMFEGYESDGEEEDDYDDVEEENGDEEDDADDNEEDESEDEEDNGEDEDESLTIDETPDDGSTSDEELNDEPIINVVNTWKGETDEGKGKPNAVFDLHFVEISSNTPKNINSGAAEDADEEELLRGSAREEELQAESSDDEGTEISEEMEEETESIEESSDIETEDEEVQPGENSEIYVEDDLDDDELSCDQIIMMMEQILKRHHQR